MKLLEVEKSLQSKYYQRDEEIRGLSIASLTKSHILFLGSPGTGKSLLARDFASFFKSKKYFEIGCNQYTKVESFVGPLDFIKLKTTGDYIYKTDNFLPHSEIAFIDEIGKCGNSMNVLLPILNERIFFQNGKSEKTPLEFAVFASNEEFGKDYEALKDRILMYFDVKYIDDQSSFIDYLMSAGKTISNVEILPEEIEEYRREVRNIAVTKEVAEALADLRVQLLTSNVVISDRRWRQVLPAIQATTFLAGRKEMDTEDLSVLSNCLWTQKTEKDVIDKIIVSMFNPELDTIRKSFDDALTTFNTFKSNPNTNAVDTSNTLRYIMDDLKKIKPRDKNKSIFAKVSTSIKTFQEMVAKVAIVHLQGRK